MKFSNPALPFDSRWLIGDIKIGLDWRIFNGCFSGSKTDHAAQVIDYSSFENTGREDEL
jgi:hypothetical protein